MIDEYKIIKSIGHGMRGTIYLVEKNKKKYALKVEKILPSEVKQSSSSAVWREIIFTKQMNKKYGDKFMTLYDYDIIDNCRHEQKYAINPKYFPKNIRDQFKDYENSEYCSRKVYSLIDTTLNDEYKRMKTLNEYYSVYIQIAHLISLMYKNGYVHNDIHGGNIGIIYTNDKYMIINNIKIPLYGRRVQLIDYGLVMHKKFKKNKNFMFGNEKEAYKWGIHNELSVSIFSAMFLEVSTKLYKKYKHKFKNYTKIIDNFMKSDESIILREFGKKFNMDKYKLFDYLLITNQPLWHKLFIGYYDKKNHLTIHGEIDDYLIICKYTPIKNLNSFNNIISYLASKIK
jgi:serine/threonine protein kinase